jgi:hypothetical protein
MPITCARASLAARIPCVESSTTIMLAGVTPRSQAATRNVSGAGFFWVTWSPEMIPSK